VTQAGSDKIEGMKVYYLILLCVALSSGKTSGATLPGSLSSGDVDRVVSIVGFGAVTRILRSAEPYYFFPGFKFGLETMVFLNGDINGLGDQAGTFASFSPQPRFYIAKGLFTDLEIIFSFLPTGVVNAVNTTGGIIRYTYIKENDNFADGCLFLGYTSVTAYNKSYEGNDFEVGTSFSKDLVRIKPYIGGSLLFAKGTVPRALTTTAKNSSLLGTIHLFIGLEVEMPINLTFQLDFFNLSPMASTFLGVKF